MYYISEARKDRRDAITSARIAKTRGLPVKSHVDKARHINKMILMELESVRQNAEKRNKAVDLSV